MVLPPTESDIWKIFLSNSHFSFLSQLWSEILNLNRYSSFSSLKHMKNWVVDVAQLVKQSFPYTRGPQFESSHRQKNHLFTINFIEKTKITKKRPGMAQWLKNLKHITRRESNPGTFSSEASVMTTQASSLSIQVYLHSRANYNYRLCAQDCFTQFNFQIVHKEVRRRTQVSKQASKAWTMRSDIGGGKH